MIKKPFLIKNEKYYDKRGFFQEIVLSKKIKIQIVFTALAESKKNVIRGLHFQRKNKQTKIIYVVDGKILDVAVNLRKKSKNFGKYIGVIISDKSDFSFYIPAGFAHGFMCLSKTCTVNYKCSNYRDANSEKTLNWDDKKVNIKWPNRKPILSVKDKNALDLEFFKS